MPRPQALALRHSQNFLHNPRLIDALIARSTIQDGDLVYEIGPGTGAITERLARRCRRLVAIEKDHQLADYLRRRFACHANVTVHAADFLAFPLPAAPYKVFANIPYASTTVIVSRLTDGPRAPDDTYLVMQREAADRFAGYPRGTLYAALLHPWFAAGIMHHFRPRDFRPAPKVESVLLRLERRACPLVRGAEARLYRDFVTYAFTGPHPSLRGTLRASLGRKQADDLIRRERFDPAATPSMVPGTLWLLLFEHMKDAGGPRSRQIVAGSARALRLQQQNLQKVHRTRVW